MTKNLTIHIINFVSEILAISFEELLYININKTAKNWQSSDNFLDSNLRILYFRVFLVHISPHCGEVWRDIEIYGVNICIQSECGKLWTRKTPNGDTFYVVYLQVNL